MARRTPTAPRRTLALAVLGIGAALCTCSSPPSLDQVVKCEQFKRLPDGSWTAAADVSLDYTDNGKQYQDSFSQGVTLNATGNNPAIIAALEKKCSASK
jgi:hypothetical protein